MKRAAVLAALLACCSSSLPSPAILDANETCGWCRMSISDPRLSGQIVAPSEEPRFFDDISCLANFASSKSLPRGSVAFVADHRTKGWVRADAALYTLVPWLATPMASHVIAHASEASRDSDPDARGGTPRTSTEVFGPSGPPRDRR